MVRAVRSGPYRESGPPRWQPPVAGTCAAITHASALLYSALRPTGELEFARARAGRLRLPDRDDIDAAVFSGRSAFRTGWAGGIEDGGQDGDVVAFPVDDRRDLAVALIACELWAGGAALT